jgi:hypothetical protein
VTREGAPLTLHRVHTALAAELRGLQQRHRVPIIATKHLLLPGAGLRGLVVASGASDCVQCMHCKATAGAYTLHSGLARPCRRCQGG